MLHRQAQVIAYVATCEYAHRGSMRQQRQGRRAIGCAATVQLAMSATVVQQQRCVKQAGPPHWVQARVPSALLVARRLRVAVLARLALQVHSLWLAASRAHRA